MLTPSYIAHTIDYIYYKSDETGLKPRRELESMKEEREVKRQNEYRIIKNIIPVALQILPENEHITAGYKEIISKKE
jgi:hypothetical protein